MGSTNYTPFGKKNIRSVSRGTCLKYLLPLEKSSASLGKDWVESTWWLMVYNASSNYIQYERNGVKIQTTKIKIQTTKYYQLKNILEPHLNNLIDHHKIQDECKIQLTMKISFISSKDSRETHTIHTKSDNV